MAATAVAAAAATVPLRGVRCRMLLHGYRRHRDTAARDPISTTSWRVRAIAADKPPRKDEHEKQTSVPPPRESTTRKNKNPCNRSSEEESCEVADDDESVNPSLRRQNIDDELSNRWIDLDPAGYFLIRTEEDEQGEGFISAAHYLNTIDADGLACDPHTGEVIPCDGSYKPKAHKIFKARTAKELSVQILEGEEGEGTVTMLVHANYLGREFTRAELSLADGTRYVQD